MTYPITPNPAIHVQPADIGSQQMLFTAGQLQAWSEQLPLAMTLKVMDAILTALGFSQADIDALNKDATAYYDAVQTLMGTLNTDLTALQNDSTAANAATVTFLEAIWTAITGYTDWSTFIAALESAYETWVETETALTSSEFSTLTDMLDALFGISPSTGQINATNVSSSLSLASLEADFDTFLGWFGSPTGSTTTTALWTDVVNDIINPLNAIVTQADTWWDQLLAELGISGGSSGTTVGSTISTTGTTAANGTAWATRLTNDLLVLSDVFHLTYAVGTSTDAPGTTSGGKPTWYSCWNDLLALCGIVNSTTAPTDTAPTTGAVISANTAAATTAGTNASIAISNASAANTAATTASTANQATNDAIVSATTGSPVTGASTTDVTTGLSNIPATNIVGLVGATVTWGATGAGNSASGSTSWSHTPAATDTSVDVITSYFRAAVATGTSSVTYGGVAMTKVNSISSSAFGGNVLTIEIWRIGVTPTSSPPSSTVVASATASSGSAYIAGNSLSYSGVKVNYSGTYTGGLSVGSNTLSESMSSASDKRVIAAYALIASSTATFGTFTGGTSRWSRTALASGPAMFLGDGAGASSTAFTLSTTLAAGGSGVWAGLIIEMSN